MHAQSHTYHGISLAVLMRLCVRAAGTAGATLFLWNTPTLAGIPGATQQYADPETLDGLYTCLTFSVNLKVRISMVRLISPADSAASC